MEKEIYVKDLLYRLAVVTEKFLSDIKKNGTELNKLNAVRENIRLLCEYA